jgi:hypothetical protein
MIFPLTAVSQNPAGSPKRHSVQRLPAYSATRWTTITRQLPDGTTKIVTQRTEVSRDALGNWQIAQYRPTNGAQYDASAPLEHTDAGTTTSAGKTLAPSISNGEALEQDEDLGTRIESGLQTQGRRRTFLSVDRQPVAKHILETWYSPVLGVVVHSVSHNFDGSVIVSELANVQVGSSSASPTQTQSSQADSATAQHAPNQLSLYRGLFSIVAHMERARLANPPSQVGNMVAVEDSLRTKMNLSKSEWQRLVTTAVKVDAYTEDFGKQARAIAQQKRAESVTTGNTAQAFSATRTVLRQMKADQDDRLLKDIKELESNVGADSTTKIHAYLNGPLAASAQVIPLTPHHGVAR